MGILPTLPLLCRNASSRYQGVDIPYFRSKQIIKKFDAFLYHGNQHTQVGKIGLTASMFEYEYPKFGFLTQPSWIRHLWQECDKHNIALKGTYSIPTLKRSNDFCLMEHICQSNHTLPKIKS